MHQIDSGELVRGRRTRTSTARSRAALIGVVGPETGRQAARRTQSQRPDRHTRTPVPARPLARSSTMLVDLVDAVAAQAERAGDAIMPGPHPPAARPAGAVGASSARPTPGRCVRDLERIRDWRVRASTSPVRRRRPRRNSLGIDAALVATELGLSGPSGELDRRHRSSRDVVAEFAWIAAQIGVDLSRFAEEIIIWVTREFGFVRLDDALLDGFVDHAAEEEPRHRRARPRQGRAPGRQPRRVADDAQGLPLAYNRDLQEDKEPVFDSVETLEVLLPGVHRDGGEPSSFDLARMAELAPQGFSLATDVADWLVAPAGAVPGCARDRGRARAVLRGARARIGSSPPTPTTWASHRTCCPQCVACSRSMPRSNSRDGAGGTAPARVAEQRAELVQPDQAAGRAHLSTDLSLLEPPVDRGGAAAAGRHHRRRAIVSLRITEVEAYLGELDPGSHAFRGPGRRNAVMYGPARRTSTPTSPYGMHVCANVVCSPAGTATAVLLRAGEIVDGVELARARRVTSRTDADLARGPAGSCVALGITLDDNGADSGDRAHPSRTAGERSALRAGTAHRRLGRRRLRGSTRGASGSPVIPPCRLTKRTFRNDERRSHDRRGHGVPTTTLTDATIFSSPSYPVPRSPEPSGWSPGDGYGRLPDRMAHSYLERTSGARYPSCDLRAS